MLRFTANLEMLFTQVPLLERFQKAAEAGFRVVEVWLPLDDSLIEAKENAGIELLQFNLDMGDFGAGERGLISLPDQRQRFRSGFEMSLQYAERLGVRQFNCLVGNRVQTHSLEEQLECMRANLEWLQPQLESNDLHLNLEPVSTYHSPEYLIARPGQLLSLLREYDMPRIRAQYDLFHAQLMEGNLVTTLRENLSLIGHIQIADAPHRHQPGTGEINYRYVLAELEAMGYDKYVGLEYEPLGSTEESLAWLPEACRATARASDLHL